MTVETGIFLFIVAASFVSCLTILISTLRTGSPPMPSGRGLREEALQLLEREAIPDGAIYELGSGWGGLARAIAQRYPDRQVIGVEASILPFAVSAMVSKFVGPKNLRFVHTDVRRIHVENAGLLLCYLSGDTLKRVAPALEDDLPAETTILSITFAWPGRRPSVTHRVRDMFRSPIYLYRGLEPVKM